MSRLKNILVSKYEKIADSALARTAEEQNARVCPKVRIADVFEIYHSGLSGEEYSYALKAHFDFIFVNEQGKPLFAVEVDGTHHFHDPKAIKRDQMKNNICDKFGFPLLRVDKAYLQRVGRSETVLDWVLKMWFMQEAYYQEYPEVRNDPYDDFFPLLVFEWGYIDKGQFIPLEPGEKSIEELTNLYREQGKRITWRPLDPFTQFQAYINKQAIKGAWSLASMATGLNPEFDYRAAISYVQLMGEPYTPTDRYVYGEAWCYANFYFLEGVNLAYELATVDLARKLIAYQKGQDTSCSIKELEDMITTVNRCYLH